MHAFAQTQHHPAFFEVLDVARRIAGNGSLGLERYIVLVAGNSAGNNAGNSARDSARLLDVKQALPSALRKYSPIKQPRWASQAERIVAIEKRLQAVPAAFLTTLPMNGQRYILREMQPSQDRVSLESGQHNEETAALLLRDMGHILAWAQLRSAARQGAAGPDELIAFAQKFAANKSRKKQLLDCARACAKQVEQDWRTYSKAYDAGAFRVWQPE